MHPGATGSLRLPHQCWFLVVSFGYFQYLCYAFFVQCVVNIQIQRSDVERTLLSVSSTSMPSRNPGQTLCWQPWSWGFYMDLNVPLCK